MGTGGRVFFVFFWGGGGGGGVQGIKQYPLVPCVPEVNHVTVSGRGGWYVTYVGQTNPYFPHRRGGESRTKTIALPFQTFSSFQDKFLIVYL